MRSWLVLLHCFVINHIGSGLGPVLALGLMLGLGMSQPDRVLAQPLVAETEALTPQEQLEKFHLPPGFVIELVAAEPVCQKPMNLKFDARGRLFFTQSVEYPWPVAEGVTGRDSIVCLIDQDGNGVPETPQIFASGLNIPIGLTPVPGGLLGYSIPTLFYFADANQDLQADSRTEFYRSFGFRDTHGMCSSLNYWVDGWVYGCHGFSNESEIAGKDGKPIKLQSGNTYRLRPDGSHIEAFSQGQVNPFGMCFDPSGDVYTSDCHTKPVYLNLRGACYPSFGKPHDGLGYGPELMPHLHGSTGIAGVVYYADTHFPADYHDNLLIGNPVTGRINRDKLEWRGSTPTAIEQPDFLTCDDQWFRPVDVQLAPDGSIYIADFYNRIIGHYEVPLTHPGRDRERGRIWRVRYVGEGTPTPADQPAPQMSDLQTAELPELLAALNADNLGVRTHATHQIVERIGQAAGWPVLEAQLTAGELTSRQLAHVVWVLVRWGVLDAHGDEWTLWTHFTGHADPLVRTHAMRALGEVAGNSESRRQALIKGLHDPAGRVQRAAVEALSKRPIPQCEEVLLDVWGQTDPSDQLLIHAIKIALREHLVQLHSLARIAQRQEHAGRIAEVCLGVHRMDASRFLEQQLNSAPTDWWLARQEEYIRHLIRHARLSDLPRVLDTISRQKELAQARQTPFPLDRQALWLRTIDAALRERGRGLTAELAAWGWSTASALLDQQDGGTQRSGLDLVRELKLSEAVAVVRARALGETGTDVGLQLAALDALAVLDGTELLGVAATLLGTSNTPEVQQHVSQLVAGLNREEGRQLLISQFKTAPGQVALSIARGLSNSREGGEALLDTIGKGLASPRLLQDQTIQQRLQSAQLADLDQRLALLLDGLPVEDERLLQLRQARLAGFAGATPDAARGLAVFIKHCASCHRVNNQGAKIGPELDGIGVRGLERLLEDTLDPSRNVDQLFRATIVALKDGRVISGLVLREEGETLVLIDEKAREQRISLADIEERQVVRLSPMPADVAEKLPEGEFYDLLSFLLAQRAAPAHANRE